jgi:hypothetical protein
MTQLEIKRKFLVHTKEIHRVTYYVEAFDEDEAHYRVEIQEPNCGDDEMYIVPSLDPYLSRLSTFPPNRDIEEVSEAPK